MKRALILLVMGTVLSGIAAYAATARIANTPPGTSEADR
jgi:hypothetical protein